MQGAAAALGAEGGITAGQASVEVLPGCVRLPGGFLGTWASEQRPSLVETRRALAIREQAVVADADETLGQQVEEEAPHEFLALEAECSAPVPSLSVAVAEGDAAVGEAQ